MLGTCLHPKHSAGGDKTLETFSTASPHSLTLTLQKNQLLVPSLQAHNVPIEPRHAYTIYNTSFVSPPKVFITTRKQCLTDSTGRKYVE